MSDPLPVNLAPLPPAIAEAIARAAKRLEAGGMGVIGTDGIDPDWAAEQITDELRPVLLGGPLPTALAIWGGIATAPQIDWATLPQRQGCIGTRYCHACKVSYGGTCLCLPNKCHHCGAECGTTPPAEDESYRHEMHY